MKTIVPKILEFAFLVRQDTMDINVIKIVLWNVEVTVFVNSSLDAAFCVLLVSKELTVTSPVLRAV